MNFQIVLLCKFCGTLGTMKVTSLGVDHRMTLQRSFFSKKVFQSLQANCSSFLWIIFLWWFKCPIWVYDLSHSSQGKCFSPVWDKTCAWSWAGDMNFLWQNLQPCLKLAFNFSFCSLDMWIFWWAVNDSWCLKYLEQTPQTKGFSFVCLIKWAARLEMFGYLLLQK